MKSTQIIYILVFLGLAFVLIMSISSIADSTGEDAYLKEIQAKREEKDHFLKTSNESPITDKAGFKGLNYFKADKKYKVNARFTLLNEKESLEISMSKGEQKEMIKYGYASFDLEGKSHRLLVLKRARQDKFVFVAFRDESNGKETYEGGRYIDCAFSNDTATEIVLDFNLAYNPYCVYNKTYTCPIPPAENKLGIAIQAGEKIYP